VSQHFSIRRVLALLVLPASMLPLLALSPSLVRSPTTLWQRIDPPAPARVVRVRRAARPTRWLVGAARFEVDAFEPLAGALMPTVSISPLASPGAVAR
jgi:hypothetical protein